MRGRLNKRIADTPGTSEHTVKLRRTAITTKLQVRTVAEMTRLVRDGGVSDHRVTPIRHRAK